MRINRKRQVGATMVAMMLIAGFGILAASAVVKVAPYYMEFNTVKGMMKSIASEPGIKNADQRLIKSKIEKYMNTNNLRGLEKSYYESNNKNSSKKNPFKVTRIKKSNNRKKLSVEYPIVTSWVGNLSFLMIFEHSVVLGEPDNIEEK